MVHIIFPSHQHTASQLSSHNITHHYNWMLIIHTQIIQRCLRRTTIALIIGSFCSKRRAPLSLLANHEEMDGCYTNLQYNEVLKQKSLILIFPISNNLLNETNRIQEVCFPNSIMSSPHLQRSVTGPGEWCGWRNFLSAATLLISSLCYSVFTPQNISSQLSCKYCRHNQRTDLHLLLLNEFKQ